MTTVATYAYLRVSTDRQDVDNQRHGILEYANTHGFAPVQFVQDAISGRLAWRERAIGQLLTATALGLAAEIERELIAARTREALAKRKAEGQALGRPRGAKNARLKLDEHADAIRRYLDKGISKRSIAKLVGCAESTLYDWLARRPWQRHSASATSRS